MLNLETRKESHHHNVNSGLTRLDRDIILATQEGLPLVPQPYRAIAEQLGVDTRLIEDRLREMTNSGVIRRIAAVPNHYRLGYHCNGMSVWDVDDADIEVLGERVGQLDFVSHAYQRPRHRPVWPYNLFAMVHGKNRDEVSAKVETIAGILGDRQHSHDILFSKRILKKSGLRLIPNRLPNGTD